MNLKKFLKFQILENFAVFQGSPLTRLKKIEKNLKRITEKNREKNEKNVFFIHILFSGNPA